MSEIFTHVGPNSGVDIHNPAQTSAASALVNHDLESVRHDYERDFVCRFDSRVVHS